jgi:hypothetical protein
MIERPLNVAPDDTAARLLSSHELWLVYGGAFAAFALGSCAVIATYRWYRRVRHSQTTAGEDLAQLADAIADQPELEPEEVQRVREAIERRKQHLPENPGSAGA